MASAAYEQILAVQAHDLTLRQLQHRHTTHPARAQVEEAEAGAAEVAGRLESVMERHHSLERDRRRKADEAAVVQDRRDEIEQKLYSGEVTATKDLLALQEESATLLTRQRGIEDEELEIMEQLEAVAGEVEGLEAEQAQASVIVAEATEVLAGELASIEAEATTVGAQRQEAAAPANPELLARYESLRDQFDGVAVARLVDGACDGCHLKLSAVATDQMAKMADDAVVTCEECGRLLVR